MVLTDNTKSLEDAKMAGVRQFDEPRTLDKALQVFWQKGYSLTSMLDLAQATGVQRGSLYNAYHGKEQMFLLAFERYKADMLDGMKAALGKASLERSLRGFLDYAIQSMTLGTPTRGCLTTKTALEDGLDSAVVRDALRGMLDDMETLVRNRLAMGDDKMRLALDPEDAARMVVTFTRGIVVVERVYQDPARLREMARLLMKVLLLPA